MNKDYDRFRGFMSFFLVRRIYCFLSVVEDYRFVSLIMGIGRGVGFWVLVYCWIDDGKRKLYFRWVVWEKVGK